MTEFKLVYYSRPSHLLPCPLLLFKFIILPTRQRSLPHAFMGRLILIFFLVLYVNLCFLSESSTKGKSQVLTSSLSFIGSDTSSLLSNYLTRCLLKPKIQYPDNKFVSTLDESNHEPPSIYSSLFTSFEG
jgi:hypothetical protein